MKSTLIWLCRPFTFFALIFFSFSAFSAEELGRFYWSDFLLQPQYVWRELGKGLKSFELGPSQVQLGWSLDNTLGGKVTLGQLEQTGRLSLTAPEARSIGIVEAYASWTSGYAEVRAGMVPVGFGSNGLLREGAHRFDLPLFYQKRLWPLRDFGVSYFLSHNHFYTQATVHNGEGGEETDGRSQLTAAWGWLGSNGMHAGLSAYVGRPIVSGSDTRVRAANLFFGIGGHQVEARVEGFVSELQVNTTQTQTNSFHVDAIHLIGDGWGLQARYDFFDPNTRAADDLVKEWTAGLFVQNQTATSIVFLLAKTNYDESRMSDVREIWLRWRLNSLSREDRSEFADVVRGM